MHDELKFLLMKISLALTAIVAIYLIWAIFTSCTYNVSMAHTTGSATDVIDDTATSSPDIRPDLRLTP